MNAQLASSDKVQVEAAENEIYSIATRGTSSKGFVSYTEAEQLQFLDLTKNQELLFKIVLDARRENMRVSAIKKLEDGFLLIKVISEYGRYDHIVSAAAERIDLSKPGVAMKVLESRIMDDVNRVEQNRSNAGTKAAETASFKERTIASLSEDELRKLAEDDRMSYDMRRELRVRLISTTHDVQLLLSYYNNTNLNILEKEKVVLRLVECAKSLPDDAPIGKILNEKNGNTELIVKTAKARYGLLSHLSEKARMEYALDAVKKHSVYEWVKDDVTALNDGVLAMSIAKGQGDSLDIASVILGKISEYKTERNKVSYVKWGKSDEEMAAKIIGRFPKFSGASLEKLVCTDGTTWKYFQDAISAENSYQILSGGKAKSNEMELGLLKKIKDEKIDLALYGGAQFDSTRKEVFERLPVGLKPKAIEFTEKKFADIVKNKKSTLGIRDDEAYLEFVLKKKVEMMEASARNALVQNARDTASKLASGGNTLVIADFYIGMPVEDALAILSKSEIAVRLGGLSVDGNGRPVVDCLIFDSKNLFLATGIEKSAVPLEFAPKYGLAKFSLKSTKVKVETNEIAFYLGDHENAFSVSGGEMYYVSETQAKCVEVTFWAESGVLSVSRLK